MVNLPENDFDSDDFDAMDLWGADGAARWTADPLVGFTSTTPSDSKTNVADAYGQAEEDADQEIAVFAVTNPEGSVSVSALMDGRVEYVQLSEKVTRMSESQLASEILVIADLARQKAQSAQYTFLLDKMGQTADEGEQHIALLREFTGNSWNLPTPEQAAAAAAEVFATRYDSEGTARDNESD